MGSEGHDDDDSGRSSSEDITSAQTPQKRQSQPKITRESRLDDSENATYKGSVDGWPMMLSSLKTLLESGKPLPQT